MIPIRDTQPSNCLPVVTYFLMGTNLFVFMYQMQIGLDNSPFFYIYGLVPAKYTIENVSIHFTLLNQVLSAFTYMFLHGGILHFLGNMWTLYIFGDNVEEHFGSIRFLGFYILAGFISGLFHFFLNPVSTIPTIGASGAIAGVMGAYFLLFPKSKILTVIPILIIPFFIEIPAFIFLGIWFLLQFLNAAGSSAGAGIAWWAHIGGFIAGLIFVHLNKRLPESGTRDKINQFTIKKRSPKLQMIVTASKPDSVDLFGNIYITSLEAITGAIKRVTIPWGFYKPLYKVTIPSGVKQGTRLRLAGMGKSDQTGSKGDLYLTVNIKNAI